MIECFNLESCLQVILRCQLMDVKSSELKKQVEQCTECEICFDYCPTFRVTKNRLFSPIGRLETAKIIFNNDDVSDEQVEAILNCPECGECEPVCPESIRISDIVATARVELAKSNKIPLNRQEKIMNGIIKTGNSVRGNPEARLNWLPEPYIEHESDTLFFAGCLPSFLVPQVATSSYMALKQAGIDFQILKEEGCCGIYFYDAGKRDLAEQEFRKNVERFKSLGIKRIIVACVGCYRCFKVYYPDILGSTDFEVLHVSEILAEQQYLSKIQKDPIEKAVTYHDPCRLGRKSGIYKAPRELLEARGMTIEELPRNQENGICCGAGAGIRSLYAGLSMDIAESLLNSTPEDEIVTSCSFCLFNLSQAAKKRGINKKIRFITEVVIEKNE